MGNGQVERMNRTLLQMLKTLTERQKSNWKEHLNKLLYAYNCTCSEVSGYSPFYLLFGRSPRLPVDMLFGLSPQSDPKGPQDFVQAWKQGMEEAYTIARKNIQKASEKGKRCYDSKVRSSVLQPGDRVLVKNLSPRGGPGKLRNCWEDGIHTVVKRMGSDLPIYEVRPEQGKGRFRILHRNLLMPCDHLPLETPDPSRTPRGKQERRPRPAPQPLEVDTDSEDEGTFSYVVPQAYVRQEDRHLQPEPGVEPNAQAVEQSDEMFEGETLTVPDETDENAGDRPMEHQESPEHSPVQRNEIPSTTLVLEVYCPALFRVFPAAESPLLSSPKVHYRVKVGVLKQEKHYHVQDSGTVGNIVIKLINGGSRCAGRVDMFYIGQWGTVCDGYWDVKAAAVVCRELGCGEAVDVLSDAHFGPGSGTAWRYGRICNGPESTLNKCAARNALLADGICDHSTAAGMICAEVRLVGGSRCSGRVEVLHGETWYTVCDADIDQQDAEVVCRELGCGLPVEVLGGAAFGRGEGQVWSEELQCRGNESQIHSCPTSPSLKHNCSHDNNVGLVCAGSVRLVDGGSRCAGRVEVLHRGQWGTVCGDNWDMRDAAVVCRELGCGEAVDAHFGPGSGPIWMDDVDCSGSEPTLKNCRTRGWGKHNCDHSKDVGVICSGVRLLDGSHCSGRVEVLHGGTWYTVCDADFDQQDAEVVCRELGCGLPVEVLGGAAFGRGEVQVWSEELQCRGNESQIHSCPTSSSLKHNCSHESDVGLVCAGSVRLVDGGSRCAGRVEVLHRGQWGTVCGDNWDMRDAAVVCRELGCGEAVDALSDAHFGPGSGPIWMDDVGCSGSESTLKKCQSALWGKHACNHSKDAGVICSGVRLAVGSHCSGRVEVLHGESWYTVCDADFDQQDAEVVCRELGCGLPVEGLGGATFGRGEGQVWSEELQCRGNESQIHSCPTSSSLKHNCSHDSDVGLVCAGGVRLVDGSSHCTGRVEVLHRGQWGTVCGDNWDMRDAAVVCRELGCGEAVDALSDAHFGPGSGPIWMDDVHCNGSESTLKKCQSALWGKHACNHSNDAGVICSGVRLVGGSRCSGRVEVLHGETWYTVCDADFDQQDAEVVCRELGCGLPVEVLGGAAFGRGEGQVWSEELQCRGNESQIYSCPTSPSLKHNCSHESDVGLVCAGHRKSRLTGGPHQCSGRVEVFQGETWHMVCDADFDQQDAEVVCRELGCGLHVEVLGGAAFGRGEGQVWSEELQCRGDESYTGAWLLNGSDSCSGRVELQYLSEWGTVCDVSWDMRAASVLCGQLKCGSAVAVVGPDWFGEGSGWIWADVFDCQGNETHLSHCPISSWSRAACSHKQDAGVICSASSLVLHEGRVRLSGGMKCEGEVELYFRQNWRRVLLDSWSESVAFVVCRQLGCGSVFSFSSSSPSSPEHSHMCVTGFNCSGSEAHLGNCSSAQAVSCSSREQLYITCSGK
ncbi:hypothetical protein NFI96_008001 [Prochilodus magdalenae]|nr:hypothetical protein NFI96_008001 [Prochilodus magdalenae]